MGSLWGGMGVPSAVGVRRCQVGSPAGRVSEGCRGAPMAMVFGAVELWGCEEFVVWIDWGRLSETHLYMREGLFVWSKHGEKAVAV
jgi:hypothetical protein